MPRDSDETVGPRDTPDTSPGKACPAAPGAPHSRYELVLIPGAAGVRDALLEVAALIGCPIDPGPDAGADPSSWPSAPTTAATPAGKPSRPSPTKGPKDALDQQ
jgi:hypothetical protein